MDGNNNGNGNGQKYSRGESFSTAALMNRGANHVFDAPGGVSFRLNPDGYQKASSAEKDKVASFVNKWLEKNKDPAADIPGAAPLFGQDVAPHAMTFASKIGSQAKTYLPSDESLEANPNDALLMRKDLGIMECLEIRQRMSALLDWSIVPEDSKSPAQKSLAAELTKIVKRIKRWTEYKRCLMDAIWIGRSAIQHTYGHGIVSGKMYCYPRAKHTDATGWKHIHGDKVVFRYDDGEKLPPGAFPDQMGVRVSPIIQKDSRLRGIQDVEYTNSGAAIFLSPAERQTIICHKHMIEDAEYHNPRKAGRIHGVGIRDRIYNEWFLKQELLGFLIEYMERSAGGIEIYEYPSGDEAAKRSVMEAAKNRMAFGRNQIFFPKPLGMDAGVYDLRIVEPGFAGIDMLLNVLDKYFGHRIKRYIIGQTLSTEADATGLGSSVADFQKDSLSQIVRYDSCNLDETVTHELVRPIHLANWPETEAWQFSYKAELESDNAKEKLDAMRTAWEMGCGIPEKDVAETVGVSLDNPNEKMLRNAQAGMAPGAGGMANGMQFPAGTGFGNQVDAAHEHVKAAGEVKGLKDGVVEHVAGKLGEGADSGAPSSPAVAPDQYERRSSRLLSEAASSTHTSPTMAQREAGNYSKGIFPWKGLEIAIENPKGSERSGVSSSGREWSRTMKCHYGYFRRTAANDGDNLDVFIGAHPDSDFVLVIKQVDQSGKFDEFKVVVGCLNRKEAKKLYLANYPAGWKCGPAASMTVDLFKEWIAKGGPMRAKSLAKVEC
jgi:phage gp29-like protein